MMLAASLLSATHAVASVFSPTRVSKMSSQCKKLVAPSRYRYDPYCAAVLPRVPSSPMTVAPVNIASAVLPAVVDVPLMKAAAKVTEVAKPSMAAAATAIPRYTVVKFKHESSTFLAPFRIMVGETVVVEGDRGENIGIVHEVVAQKPTYEVSSKVLRRATDKDREVLLAQRQRESTAVKTAQSLADNLGLHATVEDAEYQFDLNKLTIFVRRSSKNAFVDFRKLQRGLFREFRCRIWCAYMDEIEAAESAPRTH
jgi:hypothetical protein